MAEVAALKDMEAQLARLSSTVKSYQGEREQLRQALMAGVAERQALQQQVRLWSGWEPAI
jgi:prefoldin subunit 5